MSDKAKIRITVVGPAQDKDGTPLCAYKEIEMECDHQDWSTLTLGPDIETKEMQFTLRVKNPVFTK